MWNASGEGNSGIVQFGEVEILISERNKSGSVGRTPQYGRIDYGP
jgi:hypothetical protein